MLISFVVAAISFWYPLNCLSLLLAFAGCLFDLFNKEECTMRKKLATVSQGINGTERPELEARWRSIHATMRV